MPCPYKYRSNVFVLTISRINRNPRPKNLAVNCQLSTVNYQLFNPIAV
ncbi:MAG: hypothetical protein HC849_08975 [Oscillatoriales cyanobacterium RU_3_3]|nr:hypothetical protein [Oscillatoriales cyanobacterium RU_3_3]NJR23121.1 hypothetical protein [Richelia sp. CSU_2_1]